jgi:pimeloyl-ACP methyl ester carboxylesterase
VALDLAREMTARIAWKPYMFSHTLAPFLGEVRVPTLVVAGEHDAIVPRACAQQYVEALPDARLEVVAGAGHYVEIEQPGALAQLVTAFVNR